MYLISEITRLLREKSKNLENLKKTKQVER